MSARIEQNLARQQGFGDETIESCDLRLGGLNFQPGIVFPLVLVASAASWPWLFVALSLVLFWNAALPRLNPFEAVYNRFLAHRRGTAPLPPAPAPRRFAQGMAAALNLATAVTLLAGAPAAARALEALLVVAFSALLFGKICLGAYVYHVLRGHVEFANSTLPWAHE